MSRPASDYTRCPSCRHRTVLFHFGTNGEDYLACHYHVRCTARCGWACVRWDGPYDTDREQRHAWHVVNGLPEEDTP